MAYTIKQEILESKGKNVFYYHTVKNGQIIVRTVILSEKGETYSGTILYKSYDGAYRQDKNDLADYVLKLEFEEKK